MHLICVFACAPMFIVPNVIRVPLCSRTSLALGIMPSKVPATCPVLRFRPQVFLVFPITWSSPRRTCRVIPRLSFCLALGIMPSKVPATCPVLLFRPQVFLVFPIIWFSSRRTYRVKFPPSVQSCCSARKCFSYSPSLGSVLAATPASNPRL